MSDTPRTDALWAREYDSEDMAINMRDHAEALERELIAVTARVAELEAALTATETTLAGANAAWREATARAESAERELRSVKQAEPVAGALIQETDRSETPGRTLAKINGCWFDLPNDAVAALSARYLARPRRSLERRGREDEMTIDTNKAREIAQQMRGQVGCRNCYGMDRYCTDCADRMEAAALLLALAEAHDRMAKDAARYRWLADKVLACDYGDNYTNGAKIGWIIRHCKGPSVIYGPSINVAIDAAMGADQRGKDG